MKDVLFQKKISLENIILSRFLPYILEKIWFWPLIPLILAIVPHQGSLTDSGYMAPDSAYMAQAVLTWPWQCLHGSSPLNFNETN